MRKTKIEKKIKSKRHTCFKREGEIMAAEKQKIQKREGEKEESSETKYDIQSILRGSLWNIKLNYMVFSNC